MRLARRTRVLEQHKTGGGLTKLPLILRQVKRLISCLTGAWLRGFENGNVEELNYRRKKAIISSFGKRKKISTK